MSKQIEQAKVLLASNNIFDAKRLLASVLDKDKPVFIQANELLTKIALDSADFELAVSSLKKLCQLCTQNQIYIDLLTNILDRRGLSKDVVNHWDTFCINNPQSANGFYNLAYYQKFTGQYIDAISNYRKALALNIEKPEEVFLNIATIQSDYLHDIAGAEKSLFSSLKCQKNYDAAKYNLAALYEKMGMFSQSKNLFIQQYELDNQNLSALARYIDIIDDVEDKWLQEAESILASDLFEESRTVDLAFSLARFYEKTKNYKKATDYAQLANLRDRKLRPNYNKQLQHLFFSNIQNLFSHVNNDAVQMEQFSPIFICGMYRSGSTLLEQLLATHPDVLGAGELDFFPRKFLSLKEAIKNGTFNLSQIDSEQFRKEYKALIENIGGTAKKVIDKRPDNFQLVGLIKHVFPKAKFIFTSRNVADNIISIYLQRLGKAFDYSCELDSLSHFYQEYLELSAHWKRIYRDSIFDVSYDDLVKEPQSVLNSVFGFLDLDPSKADYKTFYKTSNFVNTASVAQVRKPIYKTSSGKAEFYKPYIPEINFL